MGTSQKPGTRQDIRDFAKGVILFGFILGCYLTLVRPSDQAVPATPGDPVPTALPLTPFASSLRAQ